MKALLKFRKIFSLDTPGVNTLLHVFNHTVKPVLVYGSEILGYFSHKKFKKNRDLFLKNEINNISAEKKR
jgi:hypothetical protein